MRTRAIVAIVLLLVPAALSAQRLPRIGRRPGPTRPQPLPPQPPEIARELAYKRLRVSFESYPLISYVSVPSYVTGDGTSHWTAFGTGTRVDYRFTRFVSATLDLTSSFAGGPAIMNSAELGTRIHRERTESKAYPFLDVRVGYLNAFDSPFNSDIFVPGQPTSGFHQADGFGLVGGAGTEYALTRRFSLTTGVSVMRNHMSGYNSSGTQQIRQSYTLTSYRLIVSLRFNPVRFIANPPGTDPR